jgi:hypothetical protein
VLEAMELGGKINPGAYDKPRVVSKAERDDMIAMLQKQIDDLKAVL